jgi:dihydrofolate reductase
MRKVTVTNNVTLDGVMQAPAAADEDTRGGFRHGGWALPYDDAVKGEVMGRGMAKGGALLFGRRTYKRDLIDEFVLLIHPPVLGSGTRLFPDSGPQNKLRLVESVPTTTGVSIATYSR